MKKSIVYLGVALLSLSSVALASNPNPNSVTTTKKIKVEAFENISPLNMAIYKGDIETIQKMIKYGVNINQKSNGMSPLMYAARYNKVEIIKILLANGANPKVRDEKGFTALKHAEISNAKAAAQLLKQV
ncbi:ankyrin repeat domain-containing protein [Flavobacterium eburneipallidum]|uniref:ankyrin repeat domain-containing protein n=1 Tax=Flavobacterium eburneipallidum TaxID=3003263 RepID=UPI0022ABEA0A|nr:ankyrin repeat domain-containing protein [Flavobacterium eburneipallidum]